MATKPAPFQHYSEYAEALEFVCLNWATLEWTLAVGIWACLETPEAYRSAVTDDLDINKRAQLLCRVSDSKFKEEKSVIAEVAKSIKELTPDRNLIVHGRRQFAEDGFISFIIDRGKYGGTPTRRTPAEILELAAKICDTGNKLCDVLYAHKLLESGNAELMKMLSGELPPASSEKSS